MSGGHFQYNQRRIRDIHEQIQEELDQQGREEIGRASCRERV